MKRPDPRSFGGKIILFSPIDSRHKRTGACKQIVNGVLQGPAAGLIIQYDDETEGYFLFSCDANWEVFADTWHDTLKGAKEQAEFEYKGVSDTWQKLS